MQRMKKIVAYLHDVVEDTSMTIEDLAAEGFSKTIIQAIDAITKKMNHMNNIFKKQQKILLQEK